MSTVQYYLQAELGIPAGSAYTISQAAVHLGTDPRNDVVFQAPDIGGFHATIQWVNNGFQIIDRNSGMRTTINGKPLMPAMPHLLSHGDYIQLGQYTAFRYMINPPPAPQPIEAIPKPITQSRQSVMPSVPTDTSSAYLTDKSRIGCKLCLYTLDPNDPNPAMRQFVKSEWHHFHLACYETLPIELRPPVTPVKIAPPHPLVWTWRVAIMLD